jgi:beta-lactamase superfamily II metal-dependent hydrolase
MFNRFLITCLLCIHFLVAFASDEVIFFNVGEGHCTLVYKQGHVPLLIDGGSRKKVRIEEGLQEFEHPLSTNGRHVVDQLTNKVNSYWGVGPAYHLNIILTHRDADHTKYIPFVLEGLRVLKTGFTCSILMGGREQDYPLSFRNKLQRYLHPNLPRCVYSVDTQGLLQGDQLGFLQNSGCITHLFCPRGRGDPNTWSIITRLELGQEPKQFSVLIAGDADIAAQEENLRALGIQRYTELKSHIFLFPHHGGQPLSQAWIQSIDPEIVILSAGRYEGSEHPKAGAIESIFWQGDVLANTAPLSTADQLVPQITTLQLNDYNRRERIWKPVEPHKVVYYGSRNSCEQIQRKLATSKYSHFEFVDDTWYTGFGLAHENSWRCALVDFPLYTLYSSGTLVVKNDPLNLESYKVNFVDTPSETDLMVKWIYDSVIDDDGDFMAFHLLSHQKKRLVYQYLSQTARNVREAEKIFFLSFVIIHLNYFLPRVQGLDFTNQEDITFLNKAIDKLYADAGGYEGLDTIVPFNDRCFLFDAFFTGPHLQNRNQRNDLFYLYYTVYSLCEYQRAQITKLHLQNLVQNFTQLNYKRATDKNFPNGGLEDILCKAVNIYNEHDTGEPQYYHFNINDLGPFVHSLYAHQLPTTEIQLISDVLSVLPACFSAPLHTTTEHLIALLPEIKAIQGNFRFITRSFTNQLLLTPQMSHLNILSRLFEH